MRTFRNDPLLPALPVPTLAASCALLKEWIEPLVPPAVFARSSRETDAFLAGDGEKLQRALLAHKAALPGNASWLRALWDDMYLSWRGPLPVNMNYYLELDARRWGGEAALPRLMRAMGLTLRALGAGELEAESGRRGFLAMDQLKSAVYTRIPLPGKDMARAAPLWGDARVAAARRGHWFTMPLQDGRGEFLPWRELDKMLRAARDQADALPEALPVSAFTSVDRERAALLRQGLLKHKINRLSLAELENCVFSVSLDDEAAAPENAFLGGDAACRWFDKSLQIVSAPGPAGSRLGLNLEHAGCDAAAWLHLLNQAAALLEREGPPGADQGREAAPANGRLRLLRWAADAALAQDLAAARRDAASALAGIDISAAEFPAFARRAITTLGHSPDSFVQNALQLAQYRAFGRLRSSYEAVSMRAWAFGRTECARSSSREALELAEAAQAGAGPEILADLFTKAEKAHQTRLKACQSGMGVERHMYGLQAMHEMHGAELGLGDPPSIFRDEGYLTLRADALSTSGVGAPYVRFFGFGPVISDGYGAGYCFCDQGLSLVVSRHRGAGLDASGFISAFAEGAAALLAALARNNKCHVASVPL